MANNYYQIYLAEVFKMAKTMVIKSETSAIATNKELMLMGVDVSEDKRTWRYYMNIAGLYHSTNEPMVVRSIDTQEDIEFTVENLAEHRATRREYAYGTDYYKALVNQYPLQESLILGILNPVDIDYAINAEENTILWIDQSLIDSNEITLVEQIQKRINAYLDRWHVEDYSRTEDLYDAARLAILYANLPMFILNARLENCRTIHAHSFHIRQFLASNGRLDVYMDYMTKKQQLFFYRNLPYLLRNPGAQDSFDWLTERVLVERGFPLADYTMGHNVAAMPDQLDPDIEMVRSELTEPYLGMPDTKHSVRDVLEKESRLARSNPEYIDEYEVSSRELMVLGKESKVQTKVLESKIIDRTDSQAFTMADVLLNHWLYLSSIERYRAVITINNPRTGDSLRLSVADAFTLYLYAYNKSFGITIEDVPVVEAVRVRRVTGAPFNGGVLPPLTVNELMSIVTSDLVDRSLAQTIYDLAAPIGQYISTDAFYQACREIYRGALDQYRLAAYQQHHVARGMVEAMADRCYVDVLVDLAGGEPIKYQEWLRLRGLEIEDFGYFEYQELWQGLLRTATGADINSSTSLADVHKAMLGVMSRLSSYAVQYVQDINSEPLVPIPIKWIRVGDADGSHETQHPVDVLPLEVLKYKGSEEGTADLKNMYGKLGWSEAKGETEGVGEVNLSLEILSRGETEVYYEVELFNIGVRPAPYEDPVALTDILTVNTSDIVVQPLEQSNG